MKNIINAQQKKEFGEMVQHFIDNKGLISMSLNSFEGYVLNSENLMNIIHSHKARLKDPEHLMDKLIRKYNESVEKKKKFTITKNNLLIKINDLGGFRILHLYTKQFEQIHLELKKIIDEQNWKIVEGPSAKTWDDESREYFESIGVKVDKSPNMYTSVHYIIKPNSKSGITLEVQVRTLMEEVWGEVDHSINYPHKSDSSSVREQIKVLARVTSSCSRLVDSIFSTHGEHLTAKSKDKTKKQAKK
jgi:putative GTP pyrophosphokinase